MLKRNHFFETFIIDMFKPYIICCVINYAGGKSAITSTSTKGLSERNIVQYQLIVKALYLYRIMVFLKRHYRFQFHGLMDIWCVEQPNDEYRFEIHYRLVSHIYNKHVEVKIQLKQYRFIETMTGLFQSANWLEREVWEFFGIYFFGNPDLRRLLTDYGYEWFPLRRDFPTTGYIEIKYDEDSKSLVWENTTNIQGFRFFNYEIVWEKKKEELLDLSGVIKIGALTTKVYKFIKRQWEIFTGKLLDILDCWGSVLVTRGEITNSTSSILSWVTDRSKLVFVNKVIKISKPLFSISWFRKLLLPNFWNKKKRIFFQQAWQVMYFFFFYWMSFGKLLFLGLLGQSTDFKTIYDFKNFIMATGNNPFDNLKEKKINETSLDWREYFKMNFFFLTVCDLYINLGSNPRFEMPLLNMLVNQIVMRKRVLTTLLFGTFFNVGYPLLTLSNLLVEMIKTNIGRIASFSVVKACIRRVLGVAQVFYEGFSLLPVSNLVNNSILMLITLGANYFLMQELSGTSQGVFNPQLTYNSNFLSVCYSINAYFLGLWAHAFHWVIRKQYVTTVSIPKHYSVLYGAIGDIILPNNHPNTTSNIFVNVFGKLMVIKNTFFYQQIKMIQSFFLVIFFVGVAVSFFRFLKFIQNMTVRVFHLLLLIGNVVKKLLCYNNYWSFFKMIQVLAYIPVSYYLINEITRTNSWFRYFKRICSDGAFVMTWEHSSRYMISVKRKKYRVIKTIRKVMRPRQNYLNPFRFKWWYQKHKLKRWGLPMIKPRKRFIVRF